MGSMVWEGHDMVAPNNTNKQTTTLLYVYYLDISLSFDIRNM